MKCLLLLPILLLNQSFAQIGIQPHFSHTPQLAIRSWKDLRDDSIVKQNLDYSCGAAAIATLLNREYQKALSEEDVLMLLLQETGEQGKASFADMQKIMPTLGFRAEGFAVSFEQLLQLKFPVIVYLKYRNNEHFSVLYGINQETILLADPALGHLSLSREQFLEAWQTRDEQLSGKILAIVPHNHQSALPSSFFTKTPKRKTHQIFDHLPFNPKVF